MNLQSFEWMQTHKVKTRDDHNTNEIMQKYLWYSPLSPLTAIYETIFLSQPFIILGDSIPGISQLKWNVIFDGRK